MTARLSAMYRFAGRRAPAPGPVRQAPPSSRTEVARYTRVLEAFWTMWETHVLAAVRSAPGLRKDASQDLDKLFGALLEASGVGAHVETAAERAEGTAKSYIAHVADVPISRLPAGQSGAEQYRAENIRLIKKLGTEQVEQIGTIMRTAQATGARVEDVAKQVEDRLSVGKSRAKLIARDQILKMQADAHQDQQQALGIEEYEWVATNDFAVRGRPGGEYEDSKENHWALNGTRQRWNAPPLIPGTIEHAHPGKRIQCRCYAKPVIPLLAMAEQKPERERPPPKAKRAPVSVVASAARPFPAAGEIRVNQQGLRPESFDFLRGGGTPTKALPVTVAYYPDVPGPSIVDGRHRITVARERGESSVVGDVVYYGPKGGILKRLRGVRIPI